MQATNLNTDLCTFRMQFIRKLSLYLPQPVNEENGNAQWDSDEKVLVVTLPIANVGW